MSTYDEDITSLIYDFENLSLKGSKKEISKWINNNYPDSLAKNLVIQHIKDPNVVFMEKFHQKNDKMVTFYFRFWNKRTKTHYCRHITIVPITEETRLLSN